MTAVEVLEAFGLAEGEARLREYLPRQRWFSGRDREIGAVRVVDCGLLQEADPAVLGVFVEVAYAEAEPELYHVPLAVQPAGAEDVWEGVVVGSGQRDGRPVVVYDALHGGAASFALWKLVASGSEVRTQKGRVVGRNLGLELGEVGAASVRPLGREQSNSSLVRGDLEVMKCFRKLARGLSPELEMLEALALAGFEAVAAPLGVIEYVNGDGETALVAILQPYLHNGTDGWTLALASLRDLYAFAEEMGTLERRQAIRVVREQGASFEPDAQRVGRVTARMHLALRAASGEELQPQPLTPQLLRAWADEMEADLEHVLSLGGERVAALRPVADRLRAVFAAAASVASPGMATRYHGDYHLGQLLRTDSGWTVLDFEGEPARGIEARRARSSPLRDVAGMLRSFDYAAAVEVRSWAAPGDQDHDRMLAFGRAWAEVNREAFWEAYLDEVGASDLLPAGADALVLRRAFEVQKALYEVGYEVQHRPDWVDIPLDFLTREEPGA